MKTAGKLKQTDERDTVQIQRIVRVIMESGAMFVEYMCFICMSLMLLELVDL